MPAYRVAPLVLLALLGGCKKAEVPNTTSTPAVEDTSAAMIATPDTHLFDLADSTQVWLVTGRNAQASGGGTCIERGIQLRKGPLKIPVPLLYTSTLPEVKDGKLVAQISNDCAAGASYSIDPKTGQPTLLPTTSR